MSEQTVSDNVIFVNMTKEDFLYGEKKLIQKYMGLENALASLKEDYLWFQSPTKWEDPFEKRFINNKYNINGATIDYPLKNKIFSTCFTQLLTCEAHWKAYSHNDIGVQLRISRDGLLNYLKGFDDYTFYIGKVEYLKTKDITKKLSEIPILKDYVPIMNLNDEKLCIKLLLMKRIAFAYEEEIRLFAVAQKNTNKSGIKITNSTQSLTNIIDSVYIDSKAGNLTKEMIKKEIKAIGVSKVYKSTLYKQPKEKIIEL